MFTLQHLCRGQVSRLDIRRKEKAKGKNTEGELGDRDGPSLSPVIFNQGFNLEQHNCFLGRLCRKLHIFLCLPKTSKYTGHKIQAG